MIIPIISIVIASNVTLSMVYYIGNCDVFQVLRVIPRQDVRTLLQERCDHEPERVEHREGARLLLTAIVSLSSCTEFNQMVCVHSCLIVLPDPDWFLLGKAHKPFLIIPALWCSIGRWGFELFVMASAP